MESIGKVLNVGAVVGPASLNLYNYLAQPHTPAEKRTAWEKFSVDVNVGLEKLAFAELAALYLTTAPEIAGGIEAGLLLFGAVTGIAISPAVATIGLALVGGVAAGAVFDAYLKDIATTRAEVIFNAIYPVIISTEEGYLAGATVFVDENDNGLLDAGENSTISDASGSFFSIGNSGPLIAIGGTDIATGLPFEGHLNAPAGSTVITPLTTLIVALSAEGVANAHDAVLTAFHLDPSTDLPTLDPIASTVGGDAEAALAYTAGIEVFDTLKLVASVLAGNNPTQFAAAYDAVLSSMAGLVAAHGASLDLTDQAQINELIVIAAITGGYSLSSEMIAGVEAIITNLNQAVVDAGGATGVDLLADLSAIALVAQGAASDALKNVHDELDTITSVVDRFTGENLVSAIDTAKSHTGDVDGPAIQNVPVAQTDSYQINEDSLLVVNQPGVLANDLDADGDPLTAILVGNASHGILIFDPDGSLSYAPDPNYSGPDSFTYMASDGGTASAPTTVNLTVNPVNDAPALFSQTPSQSATAGSAFSFTLPANTFQDPDSGDHLTLAATTGDGLALPSWLDFNPLTGAFQGTPGAGDAGGFDVKVTATDTGGLTATDVFHFTVTVPSTSHAPLITSNGGGSSASIIITDDSKYVTKVHATDPDPHSNISYSIVGGEDQKLFKIDSKSGLLSFQSEPREGRDYNVTVAASDGNLKDTQSILVEVAKGPFASGNSGVSDTFVFKSGFGLAVVTNFDATSSNHDVLELDHSLFRHAHADMSQAEVFQLVENHGFQIGPDVVIVTDNFNVIDLRNTSLQKLSANDFDLI
jgi:hypothetical protein